MAGVDERGNLFLEGGADAFDVAAVSSGVPQRLEHQPAGSIYEVVLDATLDKAGRYAVRVPVKLGRTSVNAIEIVQGLVAGDSVILSDMSRYDNVERVRLK